MRAQGGCVEVRRVRRATGVVRDQPQLARRLLARHDHGLPNVRVGQQPRLDLAELDAVPAKLHLQVVAAQEFDRPVRQPMWPPPSHIARPIQARGRLRRERIRQEPLRRQARLTPIPAGHARAGDV
jgi:hypothetical protein